MAEDGWNMAGEISDVTVVWQHLSSREDWGGRVFDLMFAKSCATVLKPDLYIEVKEASTSKINEHCTTIPYQYNH